MRGLKILWGDWQEGARREIGKGEGRNKKAF